MTQPLPLSIRSAAPADAAALAAIYAPYVRDTAITFEYEAPSAEEFQRRIEHVLSKYPYLVAESDGAIIGYAYAEAFRERPAYSWDVEMSIYLDQNHRGHGAGRALYQELERQLSEQGIRNLYACVTTSETPNPFVSPTSPAFHQALGYRKVGTFKACGYKFNQWFDITWFEKQLEANLTRS